jgi:cytochrome c oxidase subunit 2
MRKIISLLYTALLYLFLVNNCYAAEPYNWQLLFQTPASPAMEELQSFHNLLLVIISLIVLVVLALLVYVCLRFNAKANPVPNKFSHNIKLEIIWTIIPCIILVIIAIPSFRIMKIVDRIPETEMTVKVVGYQWYWHYIYPDHDNIEFDSYMLDSKNLQPGQKRLFDVDNRLVVPENTNIKFVITAGDVIHSFAVPALALKTDAVPGRANETWTKINSKGVYYGQCSELCGVNHGFMPIAIEVVSKEEFKQWLVDAKQKFASSATKIVKLQ